MCKWWGENSLGVRLAISYQLSAFSFQLSAFSYQPSAFSLQLPAISFQLLDISARGQGSRAPSFIGELAAPGPPADRQCMLFVPASWRGFVPVNVAMKPKSPERLPQFVPTTIPLLLTEFADEKKLATGLNCEPL
jgi:hypothetical protein